LDTHRLCATGLRRLGWTAAVVAALAFSSEGSSAQVPPPDSVLTLGDLSVSVRREFGLIGGASAIAYSPATMYLPPIPTVEEALRQMPLVDVRQNSRGQSEISIRGSESRQVAVLVDGIPLTLAWDARADPSVIPLIGAERIEVVRGLSTLLTGPNVLGGVIDISLGRATGLEAPEDAVRWSAGLDQEGGYSFGGSVVETHQGLNGSWVIRGGGGYRSRDGVVVPGEVADDSGPDGLRTNSYLDQLTGFGALRYEDDSGRWLSVSGSGQSSERGVPPELHLGEPRLWQYPAEWSGFLSTAAGTGQIETRWGQGEFDLNLGVHGGRQEIDAFSSLGYEEVADTEVGKDRTVSARLTGKHTAGEGNQVQTALTFAQVGHEETLGTEAPSDYTQRLWSWAVETSWTVGEMNRLSVSGALDGATTVEAGGREPLGAKWAPAARVGLTAPLSGQPIALHMSLSTRARFPALRELYSGSLGRFEPNPDLKPERLFAVEGGATFGDDALDLQVVGFYHHLTDAVVRVATPEGKFRRVNQSDQETTGLELLLGFAAEHFEVDGDLTFQRATLGGLGGLSRPEHTPRFLGGFDFELPVARQYLLRSRAEYRGETFCLSPDSGGEIVLDGSGRADVSVERTFRVRGEGRLSSLRARVSLDNVLDSAIYDQCGMPQAGRTLGFAIELF